MHLHIGTRPGPTNHYSHTGEYENAFHARYYDKERTLVYQVKPQPSLPSLVNIITVDTLSFETGLWSHFSAKMSCKTQAGELTSRISCPMDKILRLFSSIYLPRAKDFSHDRNRVVI